MVNNDAIFSIVKQMTQKSGPPCKKALQKMVFLIEAKGIDLGCSYGIHFYGPYSSDLDFAVRALSAEGVLKINYTEMGHKISPQCTRNEASVYSNASVEETVAEFASDPPAFLELLTTALYVYINSGREFHAIEEGVQKIKGTKYSDREIHAAIERLQETGYVM